MTQSGVPQVDLEDDCFSLADTTYELVGTGKERPPDPSGQRFLLLKVPQMLPNYFDLVPEFRGANVVELGIRHGGSTALLADVLEPRRLVALELSTGPPPGLRAFLERRGLGGRVRPYFGVDQADAERVTGIVDAEFGSEPLDLVIDDASHLLDLTRRSFELLFPRLRPGGLYVIEDWAAQHHLSVQISDEARTSGTRINGELNAQLEIAMRDPESPAAVEFLAHFAAHPADVELITSLEVRQEVARRVGSVHDSISEPAPSPPRTTSTVDRPLAALALEMVLATAGRSDVIGELIIDPFWLAIRRGDGPRDPAAFRLADEFVDPFELVNPLTRADAWPVR